MRIGLIVDNPFRDLPGLSLLAVSLCQRGAECYLVPMYLAGEELWPLAPDFVLLNYLRPNNQELARQLLDAGVGVGVLDTEGGVLDTFETYAKTLAPDAAVRHAVACYCSWGPRLAEHAVREGWYRDAQIRVTGAPRFDFYAGRWRAAALASSPYADGFRRPLVLVNGNFCIANPRFQTPEQEENVLIELFGYARALVRSWRDLQGKCLAEMVELVNRLAVRFPDTSFVYRPHPFEKLETYHELLDRRDNLHLVKQGTVDGWILRASAVVQRSCSTAIEAGLAGVPALLPAWLPAAFDTPMTDQVSVPCPDEGELTRVLEALLAGDFEPPADLRCQLHRVVEEWFHRADGRAHERAAEWIWQKVPTEGRPRRLTRCRELAFARPGRASLKQKARAVLVDALGLSVHWSFRRWANVVTRDLAWWRGSEKYFGAPHVRALVDAILSCAREAGAVRSVGVGAAHERGDYHFGYLQGHSVVVFPN